MIFIFILIINFFIVTTLNFNPALAGNSNELSFALVDAKTYREITALQDGSSIDRDDIDNRALNIDITPQVNEVKSIQFFLDGKSVSVESAAPYAMFGDAGNNCSPCTLGLGTHTVRAIAYDGQNASGSVLADEAISFTLGSAVRTEPLDASLPDDKQSEQQRLLQLVPDGSESHQAVRSGSWFDPKTWENRSIPGNGARVYIPHDVEVTYDRESDARLWTIRVDGDLVFATNRDTKLVIDTLVVMNNGSLTIGTGRRPVRDDVKAEVLFADNSRLLDDPKKMALGLISIGKVEIHGQQKTSHLKVSKDPMTGDRKLFLERSPVGWRVGDRIVLTGTTFSDDWFREENLDKSQDEVLTITSISGDRIDFEQPLRFDHDTPRPDLKAYVANLSRNVLFHSEEPETIKKRGHVMLMHNRNVDIRYAWFQGLGRTDKSRPIRENGANVPGRYALHLHRQGVGLDNHPAMVIGNTVEGSPGWGYVHHSSYAVMDKNVAYDVFGGAFIAESGDETGRWEGNIAIKGTGVGHSAGEGHPKAASGTLKAANNGTGYYFQGRLVHNRNNIAASMPGWGFIYFHRPTMASVEWVDSSTVEAPQSTRFKDYTTPIGFDVDAPSIQGFANNEVLACATGLAVIKNAANQHHDNRSMLEGFTAWEVVSGATIEYTGHYTLTDFDLISKKVSFGNWANIGLELGQKMVDVVVKDLKVDGFETGVEILKNPNFPGNDLPGNNVFINYEAKNVQTRLNNQGHTNDHVIEMKPSQIKDRIVKLELNRSADLNIASSGGQEYINLNGTKVDSTGTWTYGLRESHAKHRNIFDINLGKFLGQGYYTLSNGQKAAILPELIVDRVSGQQYVQDLVITVDEDVIEPETPYLGKLQATYKKRDGIWEINSTANAAFDVIDVEKNKSVVFSVFDNDTDIDGDPYELREFTDVSSGRVTLVNRNTGTFRYTPNADHDGYDYFEYTISDSNGSGRSSTGRVQLKIDAY